MMTLIVMAGALPMFFISPIGGVWADRHNKKLIINVADATIAVVTLGMAVIFSLGADMIGLLLICLVVRAFGQGVQSPAVNAIIPELVTQEHLTRVNGINGSIQSLVMFASPMAGGALLAVAPIQMLMFVDVVTAAIGISILVFFVKTPYSSNDGKKASGAGQYFIEIREGLRYVRTQAFVLKFIVLNAIYSVMVAPAAVMTPLQVARNWGDGVWSVLGGLHFGAEHRLAAIEVVFSAGMMLGGLVMGVWGGFKNKSHSMALAMFLFGIGATALGLLTNFWLYLVCMCLTGLVMGLFNAPMMATLQSNVDPAYMGRVFSILAMISSLMMPLGMVVWGPLGDKVAIDWLLVGTGGFLFLGGFIFVFDKTLLKAGAPIKR